MARQALWDPNGWALSDIFIIIKTCSNGKEFGVAATELASFQLSELTVLVLHAKL